jgi:hypothetical protein
MADLVLQDFSNLVREDLARILHRERVGMFGETKFNTEKGARDSLPRDADSNGKGSVEKTRRKPC